MSLLTGLVAYWPFDEGTGTAIRDVTGAGYTGVLGGTTLPSWVSVNNNYALSFPAGSSAQVATTATADFSADGSFSIAGWINGTGGDAYGGIVCCADGTAIQWDVCRNSSADSLAIYIGGSAVTFTAGSWSALLSGASTHVTVALDHAGGKQYLYVNGKLFDTENNTLTISGASRVFYIGDGRGGGAYDCNGKMWDWGVWRRPLYSVEAAQLYNNGQGLPHPFNIRRMGRPLGSKIIVP